MGRDNKPEPIDDPDYWSARYKVAKRRQALHQAIFLCTEDKWKKIEAKHREILNRVILPHESILDAGCAWGRLLNLLPKGWAGDYLGVDLSRDFIELARKEHPDRIFVEGPFLEVLPEIEEHIDRFIGPDKKYDWCVLISIRAMIIRNCGERAWQQTEVALRRLCDRLLILDYDENDEGSVE